MATSVPQRRADPVGLTFAPDRQDPRPLGVQLADAVRRAAVDGRLRQGDRLPSTRALARRLGLSRTVTAAAYDQLLAEGWLEARHGSGTFVAAAPGAVGRAGGPGGTGSGRAGSRGAGSGRATGAGHAAGSARRRAAGAVGVVAEAEAGTRPLLDLRPGAPWVDGIDPSAWRRAWRAAGRTPPAPRKAPAGRDDYRETVAEHLLRHRGLPVADPLAPDGVLATTGTAAAIVELAASVLAPGDVVALEDPGWARAAACLRAAGTTVVGVPVDEHGLVPELIPPGVRAVYCSPSHQYPLGARMPAGRRLALTDLARRHGWLVLEDDYDGELRFDLAPPPLLVALAPDVVVHLGTTSKILSPVLGAGWMVAPRAVGERLLAYRRTTTGALSEAGQAVVVELARSGDLSRHLRRLRHELSTRRRQLVDAAAGAGCTVPGDDAGAHVVLPLPNADAEARVVAAARDRGLVVDPLAAHHAVPDRTDRRHGVVVGYTVVSGAELTRAVDVLAGLLADEYSAAGEYSADTVGGRG